MLEPTSAADQTRQHSGVSFWTPPLLVALLITSSIHGLFHLVEESFKASHQQASTIKASTLPKEKPKTVAQTMAEAKDLEAIKAAGSIYWWSISYLDRMIKAGAAKVSFDVSVRCSQDNSRVAEIVVGWLRSDGFTVGQNGTASCLIEVDLDKLYK